MDNRFRQWQGQGWFVPTTLLVAVIWGLLIDQSSTQANPANFASLSLSSELSAQRAQGYAKGTIALHRIVGERDQQKNMCLGYGSPTPDHILVLKNNTNKLRLQVHSQKDTTLLIKGPGNRLYCLDDSAQGKDAGWLATQLPAGKYSIWVGSFERGQQFRYTVTVEAL
ncbi:hypothetical protein [Acaryochloris sp. IP29b_bin.137]|uniref:hypothetical protein n=1 Tax=Acaryochloris sp. IP29b_bin.137 TaxID=2969217 RepID=UPI002601EF72|nr:hypothetical protein [Acaryochloris sp. IP29b_bin.137]